MGAIQCLPADCAGGELGKPGEEGGQRGAEREGEEAESPAGPAKQLDSEPGWRSSESFGRRAEEGPPERGAAAGENEDEDRDSKGQQLRAAGLESRPQAEAPLRPLCFLVGGGELSIVPSRSFCVTGEMRALPFVSDEWTLCSGTESGARCDRLCC